MHGWAGTILKIDLTSGLIEKEPLDAGFAARWLGGEGFGASVLWDSLARGRLANGDGLEPDNPLVYATGPLTGTLAPSSGRMEIITRSPLTGIFGDTNVGGHLAPELKRAGYDMLVIRGRAPHPVYLWIDDNNVEIRDARHLWGKTVSQTDALIKKETAAADIHVSCIGPAGENKVRFAILMNNLSRAPGWTGCGAVAGSKNLKAVAVRGTGGVRIARPSDFEDAARAAHQQVLRLAHLPTMRATGTMFLVNAMYLRGIGQLHNYSVSQCGSEHFEKIRAERWTRDFCVNEVGCHGCPLQCSHYYRVKEGPYAGLFGEGYDFGSMYGFVYSYGSSNLAFAMAAVTYCNDNGLDATEPAYLMAWATDCFKRGILSRKDTGGLELDWGKEDTALELLRRITYREGFGDLLAEGIARAAATVGGEARYLAQTINGRVVEESSVRSNYGHALAVATSTRGDDHLKGYPIFESMGLPPGISKKFWGNASAGDRADHRGKAPMVTYYRHICTLMDCLGTCKFPSRWMQPLDGLAEGDYARMVSAATGMDFSARDLLQIAQRVYTLEQCYNVRLGKRRRDDVLPEMYFKEPMNAGPLKGYKHDREKFEQMLTEYYQHWGWDTATGIPTKETLEKLGLCNVADELPGTVERDHE
ncbi:MAG: aldehyde ferredoxin oxidoreductase family protein [Chloroflexi bacterium]|nr:aldehyde ferredoxin oxidoreductase family protein [Chloroflexota bacterium]